MKISVNDTRVRTAVDHLKKEKRNEVVNNLKAVFEDTYHCRIVGPRDNSMVEFKEEKYYNWFNLQFIGYYDT